VASTKQKKTNKALSAGENFAHPLSQLIGAPLLALIQAESQAAQATAEFIENIGFERASSDDTNNADDQENNNSLGQLKMATFSNQMKGQNGELKEMKVQVPLLSLIPIPALQIKDAELEFYVKILDFRKEESLSKMQKSFSTRKSIEHNDDQDQDAEKPMLNERIQLRAAMGRGPSTHQSSMESQVRIKINMTQADIPSGLSKLFHIMEQSIAVTEQGKKDE